MIIKKAFAINRKSQVQVLSPLLDMINPEAQERGGFWLDFLTFEALFGI
jgi:hypothetical protein